MNFVDKISIWLLTAINSLFGVQTSPVSSSWNINQNWIQCDNSLCFKATSKNIVQQCAKNQDSFIVFPQVVHAYINVESIEKNGNTSRLISQNDPTHKSTESFFKKPVIACHKIPSDTEKIRWSIISPSHYFARFSEEPYLSPYKPISYIFNVVLHNAVGAFFILIFISLLLSLRRKVFIDPYKIPSIAFFLCSWYFILGSADYFYLNINMLNSHKFADIFILTGLLCFWSILKDNGYILRREFQILELNTFISVLIQLLATTNDGVQFGTSLIFPTKLIICSSMLIRNYKNFREKPIPFLCVFIFMLSMINDILVVSGILSSPLLLPIGVSSCFYLMMVLVWEKVEEKISNIEKLKNLSQTLSQKNLELSTRNEEIESLQASLLSRDRMDQMGKLATSFAHQFNNILNTIRSGLMVMELEKVTPERKQKSKDGINKAITFGSQLVGGIRLTSQNNQKTRLVNLFELVQTSTWLISGDLSEKTKVHNNIPEDLKVYGNEKSIINIFMIFLSNSSDAGAGNIWVNIESKNTISIKDDGEGIKPEIADKIFDFLFTTKQSNSGSGVGLSLAVEEASSIKAEINLDKINSPGTKFTIKFQETLNG